MEVMKRAPRSLQVVALATLVACSGRDPLQAPPRDETGAAAGAGGAGAGSSGSAGGPGAAAGSGGSAGTGASAGRGGAAAGSVGTGGAAVGTGGAAAGSGAFAGTAAGGRGPLGAQTIPDLEPVAISASGLVVAGIQNLRAVRWTATTGVLALPIAGSGVIASTVTAMDREGMVFVGSLRQMSKSQAAVWAGTVQALPFARGGDDSSTAVACSGDGNVVVGTSENLSGVAGLRQQAFIWWAGSGGGAAPVPLMAGDAASEALAISQDGTTVVGFSYDGTTSPPRRRAFWWRQGVAVAEIAPPPGVGSMIPRALSADGTVVVGDAIFGTAGDPTSTSRAFRWTSAGGSELAPVESNRDQSRAVGVSNDGSTITCLAFTNGQWKDLPVPFRWQPPSPTLLEELPGDLPVPDIFTDEMGTTIVGLGQVYVSATAFLWRPALQGYEPLPLGPMPSSSVGVALSRNGSVLLGRGQDSLANQVVAWLLPLP
jgi:uncharacterized membrane protein